jgi:hypothetical protein
LREGEHYVEVVDHEVQDDVDIERTRREDAEPMGLEEHGSVEIGNERADSRVEALQVADLQNEVPGMSAVDEVVRFLERAGNGLLDEDMDAGVQQGGSHRCVGARGRADGGRVEMKKTRPAGCQAFLDAEEMAGILEKIRLRDDRIDDGSKVDGIGLLLKLPVDADMILAEGACAANCQL